MKEQEWTSGMLIADEQVLGKIKEMGQTMDSAKDAFKDYRPLFNDDRWISDREAAEFLQVSRHTLLSYRQKQILPYVLLGGKVLYRERDLQDILQQNYVPAARHPA